MGPIHIEPAAVVEEFVEELVVFWPRPFLFPFHFKASGVQQRILVFIVPDGMARRQVGIAVNEQNRIGDRIQCTRVLGADPELCFCPQDSLYHR
jgi:hypothetical protein